MKLVGLTINNFRSITKAYKLRIGSSTILVGPNNEGKSNVLKALVVAMRVLTERPPFRFLTREGIGADFSHRGIYDWERDYPVALQNKKPKGESILTPEFQLDEEEVAEFKEDINSNLNGTLPIRIALSARECKVKVNKKGPGGTALTAKSKKIAKFVAERIDFNYIPAVRTAESAIEIVNELLERELAGLERDAEYQKALAKISELQEPVLARLSTAIKETLSEFLPAVRDVSVEISDARRSRALRTSSHIIIDDGTPTPLQQKGDGAQSLAALAIMRHASDRGARGRNVLIALEEPESHLHPRAIHSLKAVLDELAEKHQVVITTHCPLFVNRTTIHSNIIVNKNKAVPAVNIEEIRKTLGVRAADNLRNAELVLFVEGEVDRTALIAMFPHYSETLRHALSNGKLAINSLGGGSNLTYKAGQMRDALCGCHCFLDNDKTGIDAAGKAKSQGLLTDADIQFAICHGMRESELEDMYDRPFYEAMLKNSYGVSLASPQFKGKKKWSDRMSDVFAHQGKQWNDKIKSKVKGQIAELVEEEPSLALNDHRSSAFQSLVSTLEERLGG